MADEEHVCAYDQNFLAAHPLTAANIIEYFSIFQFYDRGCVNEILRMQSQFADIDINHRLTTTPGFYYILEHEAPGLFVIAKKEFDGSRTAILRLYYCIHGCIYSAPSARAISESRMTDALWHLSDALDRYEDQKRFSWLQGFQFRQEQKTDGADAKEVKFALEALHDFEKTAR